MEKSSEFNKKSETQSLQIWCCQNCEAVHFKAGNVMLNFTKSEFADLTYSVNDLFQNEFGSLEFYSLVNSLNQNDDILSSGTIS